jgi:hypothetical protein
MKQINYEFTGFRILFKLSSILLLLMGIVLQGFTQNTEKININNQMPNRISMNVTVAKQTQGSSFGEKVNTGLHAAGGALAQGASLLGAALPGGSIISASLSKVDSEEVEWQVKNQGNGFSLPETIDPGEYNLTIVVASGTGTKDLLRTRIRLGVLSGEQGNMAVVSSVSSLAGGAGGGAAAASYAATGRTVSTPGKPAVNANAANNPEALKAPSADENLYSVYINGVEYAMVKGKTRHDTVKNSINNVR